MSFNGVVLTVMAVLVGLVVGFARRGLLANMLGTPVRAKALLVIGVAVPALADRFTREVAVPLVVVGLAALFAFAIVNVALMGMSVMAIGILANLMATFLNGGLPVSRHALVVAGLASADEVDRVELSGARRLEEPTHRLRFLGDIVPLAETGQVLSFGDLVILIGLADITANLTLRKRKRANDRGDDREDDREDDHEDDHDEADVRAESDTVAPTPAGRGPRPEPRTAHPPAAAMIVFESSSEAPPSGRSPDVVWFTPHWPEPTAAQPEPPVAAQPDPPPEPTLLPEPVAGLDLRDLAADDQLLQLLFADLAPTRRSRRRGPRCIPDFDPIHLDDEFSLLRR